MSEFGQAVLTQFMPGSIIRVHESDGVYIFYSEAHVHIQVSILTDHIVRVRYAPEGEFERDFSYAIDNKFDKKELDLSFTEEDIEYKIRTEVLEVRILKKNGTVTFCNHNGDVINKDEKGFHWEQNYKHGGNFVIMSKYVQEGEHFYGMGDKPMQMNLRGKRIKNFGSDVYGFEKNNDPLYKNIPFYLGIHNNLAYGIFFDNPFKTEFDFASERRTVASFWADGGEMNYYFFYGPDLMDVTRRYTQLTGTPDMPPLWTLGYHQSKWSYFPESKVIEICSKLRELQIPCDAIYLDIDYMDEFRCFTWDEEKFPNPKKMVQNLHKEGFKTVVIIDPGIKKDPNYWVFKEALENNYFCRRADGPYMQGKVWPGECYFPDYTNPKVRKWWSGLFKELITEIGVRGVWNDMNEPAVFEVESRTFPDDVRHNYDGMSCSHRKAHNIYGMQMARATYKGLRKFLKPNNRPFVITRSTYAGGQRHSSTWTGDNIASWEHLWVANVQCQRMSISGYSFVGSDIGGFIEHPTPELYVRWIQLGVFHPFCRTHSSGDHGNQEPWSFGENAVSIVKKFIELRYQLLPYLYSTFYQYVKYGTPIIRPISFVFQDDPETLYRDDEFMHGDHILICPVLEANSQGRYLYLPQGAWYDYWSDERISGGHEIWRETSLQSIPIYVREGAVIPNYPIQQYVGEKQIDQLTLHVYYIDSGSVKSMIYEDEGDGYDFESGIYNIKTITVTGTENTLDIRQKISGHFQTEYQKYRIVIHGVPFEIKHCELNGKPNYHVDNGGNHYIIQAESSFLQLTIKA